MGTSSRGDSKTPQLPVIPSICCAPMQSTRCLAGISQRPFHYIDIIPISQMRKQAERAEVAGPRSHPEALGCFTSSSHFPLTAALCRRRVQTLRLRKKHLLAGGAASRHPGHRDAKKLASNGTVSKWQWQVLNSTHLQWRIQGLSECMQVTQAGI